MASLGVLVLVFVVFSSSRVQHCSAKTWCVCREGMPNYMLQKTLDYACGAGADCVPIHQKGPCFQPNTVRAHCSYAVNSYFQRKGQAQGTCDFSGTAKCSSSDPSYSSCIFPSSASSAYTPTTSGKKSPPATTSPNPYMIVPPGINTYPNHGGFRPAPHAMPSFIYLLLMVSIFWHA